MTDPPSRGAPSASPRVAALDVGTNTVLLLVAEVGEGGELTPLEEQAEITRLGEGVDRTRALAPQARERTLRCLERYAAIVRARGVELVEAVATSAMRDAQGKEAFLAEARALLGVTPRVIPGEEEARLTFRGSLLGLALDDGPLAVVDVGGGSTEVIAGVVERGRARAGRSVSLDVGSVRLTERHLRADPPAEEALRAVRADVRSAVDRGGAPFAPRLIGVAGTVTTLAAIAQRVHPYDPARVHGARLADDELARLVTHLSSLDAAGRRAVPGLEPGRADVIVAGGVLLQEIVRAAGASEVVVSDRGVRWGLALELAERVRAGR